MLSGIDAIIMLDKAVCEGQLMINIIIDVLYIVYNYFIIIT